MYCRNFMFILKLTYFADLDVAFNVHFFPNSDIRAVQREFLTSTLLDKQSYRFTDFLVSYLPKTPLPACQYDNRFFTELKKQEAYWPYRSPEKQFKSQFLQSYDYTTTLFKRTKHYVLFKNRMFLICKSPKDA